MDIITLAFEEPLIVSIQGTAVKVLAFKTEDHKLVKFGVQAPRDINVHREEVYLAIKEKERSGA